MTARTVLNVDQAGLDTLLQLGRVQAVEGGYAIPEDQKIPLMMEGYVLFEDTVDGQVLRWNPAVDRDPRIPKNENAGGKTGFRFSPFYHEKGQYLQNVVKKGIIKTIDVIHSQITKGYDVDAYKFDDPRLAELNVYFSYYISNNFCNLEKTNTRKLDFMVKIKDIIMFLMKEDIYYRARFFELFSNLPRFELNQDEINNIQRWR